MCRRLRAVVPSPPHSAPHSPRPGCAGARGPMLQHRPRSRRSRAGAALRTASCAWRRAPAIRTGMDFRRSGADPIPQRSARYQGRGKPQIDACRPESRHRRSKSGSGCPILQRSICVAHRIREQPSAAMSDKQRETSCARSHFFRDRVTSVHQLWPYSPPVGWAQVSPRHRAEGKQFDLHTPHWRHWPLAAHPLMNCLRTDVKSTRQARMTAKNSRGFFESHKT